MITYLTRLTDERDSLTQAATDLTERAATEARDLTDTEHGSMHGWQERCAEIDRQLTEYGAQAESQRAYARLRESFAHDDEPQHRGSVELRTSDVRAAGWGDLFVESEAFKSYTGRGASQAVMVPGLFEERAEITTALPAPWVTPAYVYTPATYRPTTPLLDVIGKVTTGANMVEWLRWMPNPAPAAGLVPEGVAKQEMAMTPEAFSATLNTYAHWKGITRQALEDIPQIRSIVENRLRQGIFTALEAQVIAAITASAADIPDVDGGTDALAGIRAAVGVVQANGYGNPNAVLLNPADFASIDVSASASTLNGPSAVGNYWGLRPIAVPSVAAGTAYVGDFGTAVQLFTRGQTALYLTDSHADFFIRNVVLLLAEIRAHAAVTDPLAMAEVTWAAAVGGAARTPARAGS